MLTALDYSVIAIYLLCILGISIWVGGKQTNRADYFLGSRSLPWWAVCFSIVATETSTLTVIGVPAVAYLGSMTFLQLTVGYLLGRILVSLFLLPRYARGEFLTAYAFLGARFGRRTQAVASVTFLGTRLLADGVRLFATAIPIKLIADVSGVTLGYPAIIAGIGVFTIAYTLFGGIRAVIWADVLQMVVYLGGAGFVLAVLWGDVPADWYARAEAAGKWQILDIEPGRPAAVWLTQPYAWVTAVVGGAVFSMASHGSDQLIVQRLLACRSLRDSQIALVGSGVVVMVQFTLFLTIGVLLWVHYEGASLQTMGLSRADEILPRFMIDGLPAGISGLLLAGIVAAAMSTLSSSLNALASSSLVDLYERFSGRTLDERGAVRLSKRLTLVWGALFIVFASVFEDRTNPIVELGLAIASFTYGGMLGLFALGLAQKRAVEADAIAGFGVAVLVMIVVVAGVRFDPDTGWTLAGLFGGGGGRSIAWPWFTAIGTTVAVIVGSLRPLWLILTASTR
jgi:SSS family transporter